MYILDTSNPLNDDLEMGDQYHNIILQHDIERPTVNTIKQLLTLHDDIQPAKAADGDFIDALVCTVLCQLLNMYNIVCY